MKKPSTLSLLQTHSEADPNARVTTRTNCSLIYFNNNKMTTVQTDKKKKLDKCTCKAVAGERKERCRGTRLTNNTTENH